MKVETRLWGMTVVGIFYQHGRKLVGNRTNSQIWVMQFQFANDVVVYAVWQ